MNTAQTCQAAINVVYSTNFYDIFSSLEKVVYQKLLSSLMSEALAGTVYLSTTSFYPPWWPRLLSILKRWLGCFSSMFFVASILSIGTTTANSVESDLGCISRVHFENVTLTPKKYANTITSSIAVTQTVKTFHKMQ